MTTLLDVSNRALQIAQTRTNMTQSEFNAQSSNEAIQINLVIYALRDELLRMAPWDCAFNFNNLAYITSTPGTSENPSQITQIWQKGQPAPPWDYEYAYPADCLRACWVVPWLNTGFSGSVPITTAVTGGSPTTYGDTAVKFKIGIDQFYSITAATVAAAGTGYAVGDQIVLAPGLYTPTNLPTANPPIGNPGILQVATIGAGGAIATVSVVNTFQQSQPENTEAMSGSYFLPQTNPIAQGSTTGAGTGATFNCTFTSAQNDQRVIYTNQEFATLAYVKQIQNPDTMDPLFLDAWAHILAARIGPQLSGSIQLANMNIGLANQMIMEARKADGNEGLTINDVTPDFIRVRGGYGPNFEFSSNVGGFNWGPLFIGF